MRSSGHTPDCVSEKNVRDDEILNCWKDIAAYLERDVRTAMRWEHTRCLPVHRLPGGPKSAVYASKTELDEWRSHASNDSRPLSQKLSKRRLTAAALAAACLLIVVAAVYLAVQSRHNPPVEIRSIAVLPFENLSNSSQDYFAEGLHEALITALARAGSVRVISRTSVMQYRGVKMSSGQIARDLNVDALVEGSVMRDGDHVRITAQLIKAANDQHLWASSYDRDLRDFLSTMEEVSQAITNELTAVVVERRIVNSSVPSRRLNPEALDEYLRAQQSFHSLTREGFENALPLYRNAITIDPEFALAWRGLAMTRVAQVWFGHLPADRGLPEARTAAQKALELDKNLGEAYGVIGYIALYWDWDLRGAGASLERAVKLDPNSPMTRHQYADYLLVKGDVQGSLEQARIGHESDPLAWPPRAILMYHALAARQYDSVIREGRKVLEVRGATPFVHDVMGRALWLQGKHAEALQEWKLSALVSPEVFRSVQRSFDTGSPKAALLKIAQTRAEAARSGRPEAFEVATWFAAAGDAERAFEWLNLAYSRREPRLLHAVADPFLDPVRADPRFSDLLRRIRVEEPSPDRR